MKEPRAKETALLEVGSLGCVPRMLRIVAMKQVLVLVQVEFLNMSL